MLVQGYSANVRNALPSFLSMEGEKSTKNKVDVTRYIGIEIEIGMKDFVKSHAFLDKTGATHFICKEDGSISRCSGVELNSIPATLNYHREAMKPFLKGIDKHFAVDGGCHFGTHVHVSRAYLGDAGCGKMAAFIHSEDNRPLVTLIGGREPNSYFQFRNDVEVKQHGRDCSGHYAALAYSPHGTMELRIFKTEAKAETILRAMEFTDSVARWCVEAAKATAIWDKHYLSWISTKREDYPVLTAFLVEKQKIPSLELVAAG